MKLTDIVASINKRVGALETQDLDPNAGLARITKLYGNIKITSVVKVRVKTNLTPSLNLYPGNDVFDQIYIEG